MTISELLNRIPNHRPVAVTAHEAPSVEILQHRELASALGVKTVGLFPTRLLDVLREENITIYPTEGVENYLDRKCHPRFTMRLWRWEWYPLREVDRLGVRNEDLWRKSDRPRSWSPSIGSFNHRIYSQIVPLPVLQTVAILVDRLGKDVQFYVAAIDKNPDPFLGVRLKSEPDTMFVIERWDEPSYRR